MQNGVAKTEEHRRAFHVSVLVGRCCGAGVYAALTEAANVVSACLSCAAGLAERRAGEILRAGPASLRWGSGSVWDPHPDPVVVQPPTHHLRERNRD